MKTVIIKDIKYDAYAVYADGLDTNISFAVDHRYNRRLEQATFTFQDSSYIPKIMHKYCANIDGNNKLIMRVNDAIKDGLRKLE